MENCIFCKIIAGEIPSHTLYEDEQFKVILDVGPATKGHALILPKEHYANLYELPEAVAMDVMKLAKKMAKIMTDKLCCDGFNLVQNNGEAAGQTVFHFHMHHDFLMILLFFHPITYDNTPIIYRYSQLSLLFL